MVERGGITGVNAAPVIGQVSVSPRGFGSQKIVARRPVSASLCCAQGKISLLLTALRREGVTWPGGTSGTPAKVWREAADSLFSFPQMTESAPKTARADCARATHLPR